MKQLKNSKRGFALLFAVSCTVFVTLAATIILSFTLFDIGVGKRASEKLAERIYLDNLGNAFIYCQTNSTEDTLETVFERNCSLNENYCYDISFESENGIAELRVWKITSKKDVAYYEGVLTVRMENGTLTLWQYSAVTHYSHAQHNPQST